MAKTIYVDASRPDDGGDGLSEATAKRTPRLAQLLAAPGDKILLKTGLCYTPSTTGVFFFFNSQSNIEIGTYGTASDKPILDALTYENPGSTGWTYISDGIWKKVFSPYFAVKRVWVGSTSSGILTTQRIIGTAKRRATGAALGLYGPAPNPSSQANVIAGLSAHDIWFCGGSTLGYALYVYTGSSTINPPDYYGGLALLQSDAQTVGSVEGIMVQAVSGIYAHDLHFRGNGAVGIHLYTQNSYAADVSNCLFEDCIVTAPYSGAFLSRINGESSPAQRLRSTTVRRVYCDYLSSADEMEPDTTYSTLSGTSDLFNISDGSVAIIVDGCTAINSAHTGLTCGSTAMATTPPSGCKFINNTVRYDSWHTYARGLSNFDSDTLFSGNLIDGQNTRSQIQGSAKIIGNIWTNLRNCSRKSGVAQWIAVESYIYDSTKTGIGDDRYVAINPVNVLIANNTAIYASSAITDGAVEFHYFQNITGSVKDSTFAAGSITVKNNVIYGMPNLFLKTTEDPGRTVTQQTLGNNCAYNGLSGDNKTLWRGTSYTINAAPGCNNNIEADPLLSYDSRLKIGSPCIGLGFFIGMFQGADRKTFQNPPSLGAYEYVRPRNPRV